MKQIYIISNNSFLQEALSSLKLDNMKFSTHSKFKPGADLYIVEQALPEKLPQILITTPVKLILLIEQLRNAFSNHIVTLDSSGKLLLNLKKRIIIFNDIEINLTEVECAILKCLSEFGEQGCNKEELAKRVLGYEESVKSTSIENHIYKLRQKIKTCSPQELIVTTKQGYAIYGSIAN